MCDTNLCVFKGYIRLWHNPSDRTVALWSIQLPTEVSTRYISWGLKVAGTYSWEPYHLHLPTVLKYRSLNLLEPSGPVQGLLYLYAVVISTKLPHLRASSPYTRNEFHSSCFSVHLCRRLSTIVIPSRLITPGMKSRDLYRHTQLSPNRQQRIYQCKSILRPSFVWFLFSVALRPNTGHGLLLLEVCWSHTTTHHSR